ncbi:hypothetical protein HMPREF9103_00401 [Lentilactobacillus parafarraginis F0439]|uniref:DUF4044 domain-containing protein n=2 Tax=Lentilactobacillus parafarraginis TaxID=390842 RepID=G9ZL04_9LACO|nr:hypothetical protein HMPREF9103_00401 [Lentilactobacillus parafarraginis F0439]
MIMKVRLTIEYNQKVVQILTRKKRSTFQKITLVFVWIMIIATVGSLLASAVITIMEQQ